MKLSPQISLQSDFSSTPFSIVALQSNPFKDPSHVILQPKSSEGSPSSQVSLTTLNPSPHLGKQKEAVVGLPG